MYNDLSYNVLNYFDTLDEPLTIEVQNVNIRDVGLSDGHGVFSGKIDGVTDWNGAIYANGQSFEMHQEIKSEGENGHIVIHSTTHSAYAVYVTDEYAERNFEQLGITGDVKTVDSICLHRIVADRLQVAKGDFVEAGGKSYVVVGIYGDDEIDELEFYSVIKAFALFVDENAVFSNLKIQTETSVQTYNLLLALQRNNIDADYSAEFKNYVNNLSLVNGFLIAVSLTILAVNLIILYATFSMILRNRQAYVCRLKVAGATNGLIFAVYFVIIAVILAVICVAAYFLSQLAVSQIMDACAQAFESEFATRVWVGPVGVYFAVVTVLLATLCYLSVRKINNRAIVTATRSD